MALVAGAWSHRPQFDTSMTANEFLQILKVKRTLEVRCAIAQRKLLDKMSFIIRAKM